MKKYILVIFLLSFFIFISFSFQQTEKRFYKVAYNQNIQKLSGTLSVLLSVINKAEINKPEDKEIINKEIFKARIALKDADFWLRYSEPIAYKKINGPLAVEWETEVFEKYEKPYKHEGAGLSLAEIYLQNEFVNKDTLAQLIQKSLEAIKVFESDSITTQLNTCDNFFLTNRLFLLNLSAIYTTGFECPSKELVIPELNSMLISVHEIYDAYNNTFANKQIENSYMKLFLEMKTYVQNTSHDFEKFNRYELIKTYINPLFAINQKMIFKYKVQSKSNNDFTLNNNCNSIFDKSLYQAQNIKGIYSLIEDEYLLKEIKHIGKLLFYDPILSSNNQRSCVSCHKSNEYFTDTALITSIQFNRTEYLQRNTPSLLNVTYQHLLMLDGKHTSMQNQAKDVIINAIELNSNEKELIEKIMSCSDYNVFFSKVKKLLPEEPKINIKFITSALSYYYSSFSNFYSPFDDAINGNSTIDTDEIAGFNVFMGKAQCGTCHFVPNFNGVKPPYVSSEFEVLGVPADTNYKTLSADEGRYKINPANETLNAFRTTTIRNVQHTKPYMHNGVFNTLDAVINFYNQGGGVGHKLVVKNQTLSTDSLKLNFKEKKLLIAFMNSLTEKINFENFDEKLPISNIPELNKRKIGGEY